MSNDIERNDRQEMQPKPSDRLGRIGLAFLGAGAIVYAENLIDNQDAGNLVAYGSLGAIVVGLALIGKMLRQDRADNAN